MRSRFQLDLDRISPADLSLKRVKAKISPHCSTSFVLPTKGRSSAAAATDSSRVRESRIILWGRSSKSRRASAVPTMPPPPSSSTVFPRISMESPP